MYIETYQRSALLFSSLIDRGDERHAFVIFLALLFFSSSSSSSSSSSWVCLNVCKFRDGR